jgi:hypothetical protein
VQRQQPAELELRQEVPDLAAQVIVGVQRIEEQEVEFAALGQLARVLRQRVDAARLDRARGLGAEVVLLC